MLIKFLTCIFNRHIRLFFLFLIIFFGYSNKPAFANDDLEIQLYMNSLNFLPTYCQYRLAEAKFRNQYRAENNKYNWPESFGQSLSQWAQKVGYGNWVHIHHYCFGIRAFTESSRMSNEQNEMKKKQKLERALREFEYMRTRAQKNFPFWYDLYRYETSIHLQLGNSSDAQRALKKSLYFRNQK